MRQVGMEGGRAGSFSSFPGKCPITNGWQCEAENSLKFLYKQIGFI